MILLCGAGPSGNETINEPHTRVAVNWRGTGIVPATVASGDLKYLREYDLAPPLLNVLHDVPPIRTGLGQEKRPPAFSGPRSLLYFAERGHDVVLTGFDLSDPHYLAQTEEWGLVKLHIKGKVQVRRHPSMRGPLASLWREFPL